MGANQSNTAGGAQAATPHAAPEVKTSYYELLGLEKQATEDEIKKAYRRKALELHPDRNYNDIARATALFTSVQVAYDVLSDPQERAWYDAHEDAILRDIDPEDAAAAAGEAGGSEAYERAIGLTTADDVARMLRRFNGGVDFSDESTGFFGYLRDTFAQLAREEDFAARREGTQTPLEYPTFGHGADGYEGTKAFYAAWASFSTRKTFAWRDRWRTADAPDRRTRRLAEKENMRMREEGVREFNEAVRTLVAFVRKRDPRVQGVAGVARSEAEREKVLREVARERAARMRRENGERLVEADVNAVPEWARGGGVKTEEEEGLEGSLGSEEESEEEQFECVACRKTFKSEKQFEAHERSKKHQKAVAALRKKLKKEGVELDLDEDDESADVSGAATPAVAADDFEADGIEQHDEHETNGLEAVDEDTDRNSPQDDLDNHIQLPVGESLENLRISSDIDSEHEANDMPKPDTHAEIHEHDNEEDENSDINDTDSDVSKPRTRQKVGKAAQKRAKKAAQASVTAEQAEELQHKCASCRATFPSRSRLFQHIKDHGHAAPVPAGKQKGKKR